MDLDGASTDTIEGSWPKVGVGGTLVEGHVGEEGMHVLVDVN